MTRSREPKRPAADEPMVANYPPLDAWLTQHGAKCLWQLEPNAPAAYRVEGWRLGTGVVIVVLHAKRAGWNVYSAHPGNDIAESLADAVERCSPATRRIVTAQASRDLARCAARIAALEAECAGLLSQRNEALDRVAQLESDLAALVESISNPCAPEGTTVKAIEDAQAATSEPRRHVGSPDRGSR